MGMMVFLMVLFTTAAAMNPSPPNPAPAVAPQPHIAECQDFQANLDILHAQQNDDPFMMWSTLLREAERTGISVVPELDEDTREILEEYGWGTKTWEHVHRNMMKKRQRQSHQRSH